MARAFRLIVDEHTTSEGLEETLRILHVLEPNAVIVVEDAAAAMQVMAS